jgi:dolichol-phosphate mannosyltransferase
VVLLTPVGLVAASRTLFARSSGPGASWLADRRSWLADRRNAFIAIYTLVPLSVFVAFSLFHEVKLNWTGPVWLAILPALAGRLVAQEPTGSSAKVSRRSWLATVAVALLIYGAALHYLVLGLPGIAPSTSLMAIPIGWKEFGAEVEKIATDIENATGKEPLRVGMDRYFLSSEIAFYDPDQDAVPHTAGRSLFGLDSLMYERWIPPAVAKGRDILLVSRRSGGRIAAESLSARFRTLGPIQEHIVHKGAIPVGRFYWRIGYGYIPNEP